MLLLFKKKSAMEQHHMPIGSLFPEDNLILSVGLRTENYNEQVWLEALHFTKCPRHV